MTTRIDSKFWKSFAKKNWEKQSLLVSKIDSKLSALNEAQVFALLLKYCELCRRQKSYDGLKFFVDGQRLYDQEIFQVLPVKKDQNLIGYHKRISAIFPDYCLVCDELLQVSSENWDELTRFTQELYDEVGFPNRFAEMGLYLGNYRKTPFGVHVDACGVFSFPVVGQKNFRLWDPKFVEKNPALKESHSYSKFKKNSVLMKVSPGDMSYWPSSAWHIAESTGQFSATWSLGVWVDKDHSQVINEALSAVFAKKIGKSRDLKMIEQPTAPVASGELRELPPVYQNSMEQILKISELDLQDQLMQSWLRLKAQSGFKSGARFEGQKKLTLLDRVQLRPKQDPILWRESLVDDQVFIAHGTVVISALNKKSKVLKLILSLNSGRSCLIKDYVKSASELSDLQKIFEVGAFVRK